MKYYLNILLLLLLIAPTCIYAQAPAYCPVTELLTCKDVHDLKCSPKIWHGIDSLEVFQMEYLNDTAVTIKSLNNTFKDTIARIVIEPKDNTHPYPLNCVKAPPIPTSEGNCTTYLEAYFSDAGKVLKSTIMESCGIIGWMNGFSPYGDWVHADEPTPAPVTDLCKFNKKTEIYHEVGSEGQEAQYFTIDTINATAIAIKSLNNTFPDTITNLKIVHGAQEKIAFTAKLYDGKIFHGIMRSNGAGTPNCCEQKTLKSGEKVLTNCPVISWWDANGDRYCWETTILPHDNEGECSE